MRLRSGRYRAAGDVPRRGRSCLHPEGARRFRGDGALFQCRRTLLSGAAASRRAGTRRFEGRHRPGVRRVRHRHAAGPARRRLAPRPCRSSAGHARRFAQCRRAAVVARARSRHGGTLGLADCPSAHGRGEFGDVPLPGNRGDRTPESRTPRSRLRALLHHGSCRVRGRAGCRRDGDAGPRLRLGLRCLGRLRRFEHDRQPRLARDPTCRCRARSVRERPIPPGGRADRHREPARLRRLHGVQRLHRRLRRGIRHR